MALFWIIHLVSPYFKHIERYNILFYECGIVWKVIYRTSCISVGYTMLPFIRVCIIMCILVHLTKNSQHICFASSNHNKVKEKKMFIRLHDNISPKCCNIVSLWAASCRKTLLLEFWRTLKKSRCDIHPACCLIKLASYSTNVQDFKVGFVFIYCLGKYQPKSI